MSLLRYHEVPCPDGTIIMYPAITSLIEQFAIQGLLGKENEFIPKSEAAANDGIDAHALIGRINNGGHIPGEEFHLLDRYIQNSIRGFLTWRKDVGFKPKLSEAMVYSHRYGICGHPDSIGTCKSFWVTVCDWKLGDIYNIRVKLQISAYGFCYLEMFPRRTVRGFRAVHLDKYKGTYSEFIMSYEEGRDYFEKFINCKKQIGMI